MALSREDDRRMSSLEATSLLITHQQTTLTNSVAEVKAIVDRFENKLDNYFERLVGEHAEPKATPAGRSLNAAIERNSAALYELDKRVDSLDAFRNELRGALGFLRIVVTVSAVLSAAAVIISALHAAQLL